MDFSPAFALLQKFTIGIPESSSRSSTIDEGDIESAADYLGIDLPDALPDERIKIVQEELIKQNRFLTENLSGENIRSSRYYDSSRFVREIVTNNRERKRDA